MTKKWPAFWSVVILTALCFSPDLRNGLLDWDDKGYIVNNFRIRSLSLDTVRWAFTEFYCSYWSPMTWLSYAVDYAVWGLNPVGYHLTNNLIHALSAGLFFLISCELLKRPAASRPGAPMLQPSHIIYCSALAALLFGIHPLRVESVAWATERKDVLSTFFGLGAVLAYLKYATSTASSSNPEGLGRRRRAVYCLVMLLYALSLMSKAMLITLPVALLLLDWYPLRRLGRDSARRIILEKLPLFLMALSAAWITLKAIAPDARTLADINMPTRLLTAFKAIMLYLRLTVLPIDISPVYFHPGDVAMGPVYALSILVFTGISIWCLLSARRQPVFLAAWLFFVITLLPMLGLTQSGQQEFAARFTYFPSLSPALLVSLGVTVAYERLGAVHNKRGRAILAGVLAALAASAYFTVRDIGHWKNDIALWTRVIELQPHKFGKVYYQRSLFLHLEGEYQKALSDVNEAIDIALRKNYGGMHELYAHRARIHKDMRDLDAAVADFSKAIDLSGEPYSSAYSGERRALYEEGGR